MINFSIIIPNFNGAKFLPSCLKSILSATKLCPKSKFEIILIDNGSKDDSYKVFTDFFNQNKNKNIITKVISKHCNLGFAKAANIGISNSIYDWVVLFNNDLNIKADWFQLISDAISNNKDPKTVTFFGTVLNFNGTKYESQGLDFFIEGKAVNVSNNEPYDSSKLISLSPKYVWGSSAALVVYKKEVIFKIGMFDSDFFAYLEDVDLTLRLNLLNYKTLYIPQAICCHLGGGTSNQMQNFRYRMVLKNWFFIIIKNYSFKTFILKFPKIIEERLRNFSALLKTSIKFYGIKSIYQLPIILITTYGELIIKLPKMVNQRKNLKKLLQSTKL